METIFLAATGIMVFAFTALAVVLWNVMAFLKTDSFDFRFAMLILLAYIAKLAFDRVKAVVKAHP